MSDIIYERKKHSRICFRIPFPVHTENRLGVGDELPGELELAEIIGVSRSSVREALITMKTLGIIQSRRKGGIRICRNPILLDIRKYLSETYEDTAIYKDALNFREILEWGMAEQIFDSVKKETIQKLRNIVKIVRDQQDERVPLDDPDRRFHTLLMKHTKNNLAIILAQVYQPVFEYNKSRQPDGKYTRKIVDKWLKDHSAIIEALELKKS